MPAAVREMPVGDGHIQPSGSREELPPMAKVTHDIAYQDRQYLWSFSPAADMTGAYEDQYDLERLLKTPTKAMAAQCLTSQISYWFDKGTQDGGTTQVADLLRTDPKVRAIYKRHVGMLSDDEDE
jgi:hypothetical protein